MSIELSPMELLFSVLTCNNFTTSIHAKNWIWHSLKADYIIILCFPYLQFQFLCFTNTWPLKIYNIIWSASKTVKQQDLINKAVNWIVSYGTIIFCSYLQQFHNQYPCQELNLTFTKSWLYNNFMFPLLAISISLFYKYVTFKNL